MCFFKVFLFFVLGISTLFAENAIKIEQKFDFKSISKIHNNLLTDTPKVNNDLASKYIKFIKDARLDFKITNSPITPIDKPAPNVIQKDTRIGAVTPMQRDALMQLYNATGGRFWKNNTNWGHGDPCLEQWYGIECFPHSPSGLYNAIALIGLEDNNLNGYIPTSIASNLKQLQFLDLSNNNLSGNIPNNLFIGLQDLRKVDLSYNNFTGYLPTRVPNGWRNELTYLNVSHNKLSQIADPTNSPDYYFTQLAKLKHLYLGDNLLTGAIPYSLRYLYQLEELGIENNKGFTTIPPISDLKNLRVLNMFGTGFLGTLDMFVNLTNLVILDLGSNRIQGPIPSTIGNLRNLKVLNLGYNETNGPIPTTIGNLTNLEIFYIHNNFINGPLPYTIGNLRNLKILNLNKNRINGPIPREIGNLRNLETLVLSYNELDFVPNNIWYLAKLKELFLNNNNLKNTSNFFSIIDKFSLKLEKLYLNDNLLHGNFNAVKLFNTLKAISLHNNDNITFQNDRTITLLNKLGTINIEHFTPYTTVIMTNKHTSNPSLKGEIDAVLDLYYNTSLKDRFTITEEQCKWKGIRCSTDGKIVSIDFRYFHLDGIIPPSISKLTSLRGLELKKNNININSDSELFNLPNLAYLDLSDNQVTGNILESVGKLTKLKVLKISNINTLYGSIPNSIGNLKNLTDLEISNNKNLTGDIPSSIGNLKNLTGLTMSHNNLTGKIPTTFANLNNLGALRLNHNNLTGKIPNIFGENKLNLYYFNVSYNRLSGTLPTFDRKLRKDTNTLINPTISLRPRLDDIGDMAHGDFNLTYNCNLQSKSESVIRSLNRLNNSYIAMIRAELNPRPISPNILLPAPSTPPSEDDKKNTFYNAYQDVVNTNRQNCKSESVNDTDMSAIYYLLLN